MASRIIHGLTGPVVPLLLLLVAAPAAAQFPTCVPVSKGRMNINTYSGSYGGGVQVVVRGFMTVPFPFTPSLDPPTTGIGFHVFDGNGAQVGHGDVEPLSYFWRMPATTAKGTRWTTASRHVPGTLVATVTSMPGVIKFKTKGGLGFGVTIATLVLPLRYEFVLSDTFAAGSQCGEATFPGPAPLPRCIVNSTASRVGCR